MQTHTFSLLFYCSDIIRSRPSSMESTKLQEQICSFKQIEDCTHRMAGQLILKCSTVNPWSAALAVFRISHFVITSTLSSYYYYYLFTVCSCRSVAQQCACRLGISRCTGTASAGAQAEPSHTCSRAVYVSVI